MTSDEKKAIDKQVLDIINSLVDVNSLRDCIMYVRGDAEYQNAVFVIKGNPVLVSETLIHHIDKNFEFRQLLFSTIGTYLAKHPEHERDFNAGMIMVKQSFGVN